MNETSGRRAACGVHMVQDGDALDAADAGRGRSGQTTIPTSGSTFSSARNRTPPASAPAATSPTTRAKCRCTMSAGSSATRDPFGELVEGARRARHACDGPRRPARHPRRMPPTAHPEWIAVDADGEPRRHWAFPGVWVTCAYGDYNLGFMPEVVREIARNYDIDAVFANRWQGHGVCYCDSCRRTSKPSHRLRPAAR